MVDKGFIEAVSNLGPHSRVVKPAREPIKLTFTLKLTGDDVEGFFRELAQRLSLDLDRATIEVHRRGGSEAPTVYITHTV